MTFFFYDLETSGINPKTDRVMQFAGQRTDINLNPIGDPYNILVKLTEDILPQPDAVLVTGITPQKSIAEGITEAEFMKLFYEEIAERDTVFVGFNTVRFDDEFMRYMHYRNFYDPYEWQWKDGRSRWDLLDVVRMTRALRPEGIEWPFDSKGNPSNRLELLSKANNLDHANAHDALSDVKATIAVASLIKEKQPKLFAYLFELRDKKKVRDLVENADRFIYTSGKYPSEQQKTTIATKLASTADGAALVYDLAVDPKPFLDLSEQDIIAAWKARRDDPGLKLPVKTLKYNRCPAVAPLSVLDDDSQKRLGLDLDKSKKYYDLLRKSDFGERCLRALKKMDKVRNVAQAGLLSDLSNVDERLYDGFIPEKDRPPMRLIRAATGDNIHEISAEQFTDERLQGLVLLYKSRNFNSSLTDQERNDWEKFRSQKLLGGKDQSLIAKYMKRLEELSLIIKDNEKLYLLDELRLYAESIVPEQEQF